ncbi:MAG TPA: hypothetical protein VKB49_23820 [Candidatus Sulfotelmatobacter sp.]|nr:hypothetical protein [Candidatus Sulfotelmatobacter sp.]
MKLKGNKKQDVKAMKPEHPQHRIHLPGFLVEHEIGLGDVIKRATSSVGIRSCGGCERRAAALNRWMTFLR